MTAISAQFLAQPLRLHPPVQPRRRATGLGRTLNWADDTIDDQFEAQFGTPIAIPAPDTDFVLVRAGVRLRVGLLRHISWMRVQFETQGEPVVSMFPRSIAKQVTFTGRISLDPTGVISRRPSFDDISEMAFQPFVRGNVPRLNAVSWDFLPEDPQAPLSCDSLLFATRAGPNGVSLTATLMVAVGRADSEPDYFELTDDLMAQ